MSGIIRFEQASKAYGGRRVLRDFNLSVEQGELLTVVGSSGCGKTTMLKMVNALILPDSGRVLVEGRDVAGTDRIALRRGIGYAIQNAGLFPHLSVWKNIAYVPELVRTDKAAIAARVRELLRVVGLEPALASRYPAELSGGQQQRVGIARALAASPRIVLMDEPFGAVDAITRARLQDELLRLHDSLGLTILFVTHDMEEALRLGTQVLVMDKGGMVQLGTPETIARTPANGFVRELLGCERGKSLRCPD